MATDCVEAASLVWYQEQSRRISFSSARNRSQSCRSDERSSGSSGTHPPLDAAEPIDLLDEVCSLAFLDAPDRLDRLRLGGHEGPLVGHHPSRGAQGAPYFLKVYGSGSSTALSQVSPAYPMFPKG